MTPGRSPKRRGLWAAGLLCAGNAIAHAGVAVESRWTFLGSLVLAIACLRLRSRWQMLSLGASVLLLGHATFTARTIELSPKSLGWKLSSTPSLVEVEGMIISAPRIERPQRGRLAAFAWYEKSITRFEFRVESLLHDDGTRETVDGSVWVRIGEDVPTLHAGDRLRMTGMASRVDSPTNPGERDPRPTAMQRGIVGRLSADSAGTLQPLPSEGLGDELRRSWLGGLSRIRSSARQWIEADAADDPSRALLVGLLLGERSDGMRELSGAFSRVGLAHVLSVSGFHLVAFVMTLVLFIRLHGEHPRLEPVLVALCVGAYLMVIPAQAPIIRAGAMTLALLAAESFGRRYDRLNTLALVLAGVVLWRPMELWDIGCQLSFLSVAALIVFAKPLRDRLFGERPNRDELAPFWIGVEWLKDALSASIAAWLFTAPLVAYHLGVVSPLAPIATLVTLPLAVGVVGLGYAAVVLGLVVPWASGPARWLIDTGAGWLAEMVLWIDTLPGSVIFVRGHGVSAAWAIGAMLVLGWWMTHASWRRWTDIAAVAVVVAWAGARLAAPNLARDVALRMDSLDVGDGSCHLLRSGNEAVLYDCGSTWYAVGERIIPMALRSLGAPRVETIILSHPDIDHFSGVIDVLRPLGVRRVLIGEAFERQASEQPDGAAAHVLSEIRRLGVEISTIAAGAEFRFGVASLKVVAPAAGTQFDKDNDASLVIDVRADTSTQSRHILLCGDVEVDAIARVRRSFPHLQADVMEAPHHGSARPAAIEWVAGVDPGVVVQSTGPSRVRDPRWEGVRSGRVWRATAESGAVWAEVTTDGNVRSGAFVGR